MRKPTINLHCSQNIKPARNVVEIHVCGFTLMTFETGSKHKQRSTLLQMCLNVYVITYFLARHLVKKRVHTGSSVRFPTGHATAQTKHSHIK